MCSGVVVGNNNNMQNGEHHVTDFLNSWLLRRKQSSFPSVWDGAEPPHLVFSRFPPSSIFEVLFNFPISSPLQKSALLDFTLISRCLPVSQSLVFIYLSFFISVFYMTNFIIFFLLSSFFSPALCTDPEILFPLHFSTFSLPCTFKFPPLHFAFSRTRTIRTRLRSFQVPVACERATHSLTVCPDFWAPPKDSKTCPDKTCTARRGVQVGCVCNGSHKHGGGGLMSCL